MVAKNDTKSMAAAEQLAKYSFDCSSFLTLAATNS